MRAGRGQAKANGEMYTRHTNNERERGRGQRRGESGLKAGRQAVQSVWVGTVRDGRRREASVISKKMKKGCGLSI